MGAARLRLEGDLVALRSVAGGASYMGSIRIAGKMTTAAETFGVGVSHGLRRPRGNIMTAPIAPPDRFTDLGVTSSCRGRGECRAINAPHG